MTDAIFPLSQLSHLLGASSLQELDPPVTPATSLLSLPNETLDQIIRHLFGPPVIGTFAVNYSTVRNRNYKAIRLVNRRLSQLATLHSYYCHRIISERQLIHETTHLTEVEILRRRYTQQLTISGVPVLHWFDALRKLYPSMTHLNLSKVRISEPLSDSFTFPRHPFTLPNVKHLSIFVSNNNEDKIPTLLQSFPNLITLSLDSDPSVYDGMDTKFILAAPPLPYLTTLHRPPLKRNHLKFETRQTYANYHRHKSARFNSKCHECAQWLQNANSGEQIAVTQLAWILPSLREVLIPRLIFDGCIPLNEALYSQSKSTEMGDMDWSTRTKRRADIVTWTIEDAERATGTPELYLLKETDRMDRLTHALRCKPFRVFQQSESCGSFMHSTVKFWQMTDMGSPLEMDYDFDDGFLGTPTRNPRLLESWDL